MILPEDSALLKKRYENLHPLIFHRSVEKAKDLGELFEILEGIPPSPPLSWDESKRRWVKDYDIIGKKKISKIAKK